MLAGNKTASAQSLNNIYKSGEGGYICFRIPSIVTTTKGTLLAFAEARMHDCSDAGDIDLVVKRSFDGGKTWTGIEMVWNDADNTCGNPAPVVDQRTGKIILLATWNLGADKEDAIIHQVSKDTRRVYVLSSSDDGASWSAPREITSDVKKNNWNWYATGPVNGIQIKKGKYKGRLVVPCDHIDNETMRYFSHAIYSDDGGNNWKLGGIVPKDQVNECTVAELSNGTLMLNMRNNSENRIRQVATSKDGGASWSNVYGDSTLIEPVCQGSLLRYEFPKRKSFLAFSNPASTEDRISMTVRISYDNGKTWPLKKLLHAGPVAYSNLVVLPNGNLGCLYEAGHKGPYEGIVFEELAFSDFVKE
ncbi:sialidase family protein [Chitinophaga sp. MM2321]|uniref:sialidase family protein n=1 Tax=Chitinophaga sp. MM2321 TaxID=3137178 RepID=UPI0032D59FB6